MSKGMIFTFKSEKFYKFSGLMIVSIGYIRVSATGDFSNGRYLILVGLLIQMMGLPFYFRNRYNKKQK